MVEKIFQNEDPLFYSNYGFQKLLDYDTEKQAGLLHTLRVWMKCGRNAAPSAEELHISRTACIYRIRRIEEI